jgi:mRNA-degrading endonuclease toxin of MazEF toxin-antitoxin module
MTRQSLVIGALVAACTTTIRRLPSEVVLAPDSDPIRRRSAVNLDSVESVAVAVLVSRLGRLADLRIAPFALPLRSRSTAPPESRQVHRNFKDCLVGV